MASLTERFLDPIEAADDLPALSGVLAELIRSLDSVDSTVPEIAAIIRQDPVITAQVLRAANAAAYAGYGPVASVHQALLRLGIVRVRRIAILASLYAAVPFRGRHIKLDMFWRHAIGVAHLSETLAEQLGLEEVTETAFLAGLLHDIALLALQSHFAADFVAARHHAERERVSLPEAELALFGTDHGELGALIARHWGLPDALVDAIRAHHRQELAQPPHRMLARITHAADELWSSTGDGDVGEGIGLAAEQVVEDLGLDPRQVGAILEATRNEAAAGSGLLSP